MTGIVIGVMALLMAEAFPGYNQMLVLGDEEVIGDLTLKHTEVEITVEGSIQLATVRQIYENPFSVPIETIYIFPLPEDGAVYKMNMEIGDRRIVGEIKEREEARQIYEEALSEGRTAALLEEERPNIFTQTVGNILPGEEIVVEIAYAAPVSYNDGEWSVVFPMVVGPRFNPDGVEDASRITPGLVPEGTRSGYDIELSLSVDPGLPIREFESLNHAVKTIISGDNRLTVELSREHEIPNRDFVFTYRTAGDDIATGIVSHYGELGGHFMLLIEPDAEIDPDMITPKEIFFVVDNSGSMAGQPMEAAKETVRRFVRGMNPADTFQIMRFSETASSMSRVPLVNTPENVERGIDYINSMSGTGGTMMIEGIRASVGYREDPKRMRYIIFITDGYIGNEREILSELRTTLGGNTRLFSIGVGSSVNRYLIEGLAEEGRGYAEYITLDQDPAEAVEDIYRKINNPYLVDISIDWGNLDVTEVYPSEIRDLCAGEPLVVAGRYTRPGRAPVTVHGTLNGRSWEKRVVVDLVTRGEGTVAADRLWARRKIHELNRFMLDIYGDNGKSNEALREEMIGVSLDYGVLCEYTAFVAVDSYEGVQGGYVQTVSVPVNMPEGVSYSGIYGGGAQRAPSAVPMQFSANESPEQWDAGAVRENEPLFTARLESIGDYLGARPSVFRALLQELIDELNSGENILSEGEISFRLRVDASGTITGISIVEDTVGVEEVVDAISDFLVGKTIDGAAAGTSTVTIVI